MLIVRWRSDGFLTLALTEGNGVRDPVDTWIPFFEPRFTQDNVVRGEFDNSQMNSLSMRANGKGYREGHFIADILSSISKYYRLIRYN